MGRQAVMFTLLWRQRGDESVEYEVNFDHIGSAGDSASRTIECSSSYLRSAPSEWNLYSVPAPDDETECCRLE